jgi:hypothetical protein
VTGLETDRDIVDALILNENLCTQFTDLVERELLEAGAKSTAPACWIRHAG